MRQLLVSLAAGRQLLLLALLLHGVILSQLSARTTVAAVRVHVREMELQRSLARYRLLLQNDDSRGELVKSQELDISSERERNLETYADDAVQNPEKSLDKLQAAQGFELKGQKDDKIEVEENNQHSEMIEEQKRDQEDKKQSQQEQQDSAGKAEEPHFRTENGDKVIQPRTAEEINSEERILKSEDKNEERATEESKEAELKSDDEKTIEREGQAESKIEEEKTVEEEPFVFPDPYLLGPTIKDWDEQRKSWLEANPSMKSLPDGKPRVLVVTGSQPNPCHSPVGDHFNLRSLKLKIDYARIHNYEIYYNFAWLDPLFGSYWVKLPILRTLMLTHPEIEWFFWIDSDALFTDMVFEAPFHTYDSEGINMIMWGYEHGFYVEKSWVAFNAGVFIIRNCQWSLDLIDKWSPMGPDGPVRDEYGKMLTSYLSNRIENYPADDQSALAYLLLTDEAVKSKVKLVDLTDYMVSAWWVEVVDNYETSMENYHPGLGDWRWPWITHFTGCGPCNGDGNNPDYQKCMKNIERALNFADNQVLAYMGFQHKSLSSASLVRTRNESNLPLEFVGVNPWEERIAQVAAAAS